MFADANHAELVDKLRQLEAGEVDDINSTLIGQRKDGSHVDHEIYGGVIELEDEPDVMGPSHRRHRLELRA